MQRLPLSCAGTLSFDGRREGVSAWLDWLTSSLRSFSRCVSCSWFDLEDPDQRWTCDMTSRSYFGKMNSTLGSVVPLAMLLGIYLDLTFSLFKFVIKPSFACQGIIILLSFNFKYYLIFAASVFSGLLQLCSRITNRFCTADQILSLLPSSSILIL